jgi:lipid-A-disaccharide synthase
MPDAAGNTIWISAGEASGDLHGALLARALKARDPGLDIAGMGGPAMQEAGCRIEFPMRLVSVLGGTEVLAALPRILKLFWQTRRRFKELKPKAVVVIDCPEIHFRVARIAHRLAIPAYYFVCPQVWAWRTHRVRLIQRDFRKALCILPFEREFYARHGCDAQYVGNPLLDQLPLAELDALAVTPGRIGILPGSRRKEIAALLPGFAAAARILRGSRPDLRFLLLRAPGIEAAYLRAFWPAGLPVDIVEPGDRYRGMRACELLLAASGTATLESALIGTPTVVAYRLSRLSFAVARRVVKVPFVSLPNLILGREVFPELLQERANAEGIAAVARAWLADGALLASIRKDLGRLRQVMGEPGVPGRAAGIILDDLAGLR